MDVKGARSRAMLRKKHAEYTAVDVYEPGQRTAWVPASLWNRPIQSPKGLRPLCDHTISLGPHLRGFNQQCFDKPPVLSQMSEDGIQDSEFPFEQIGEIREENYGLVDVVRSSVNRRECVRKRTSKGIGVDSDVRMSIFKFELDILKQLRHPHCINLVASYADAQSFGMLMQPVTECDLSTFLHEIPRNPAKKRVLASYFGCLANAVDYLHEAGIQHRDIRSENILIKNNGIVLVDFGISADWREAYAGSPNSTIATTLIYTAPEVVESRQQGTASDIWSLGCVLIECWTVLNDHSPNDLREFFRDKTESRIFYLNARHFPEWFDKLDSAFPFAGTVQEWLLWMTDGPHRSRISASKLKELITRFAALQARRSLRLCGTCCLGEDEGLYSSGDESPTTYNLIAANSSGFDLPEAVVKTEQTPPPPVPPKVSPPRKNPYRRHSIASILPTIPQSPEVDEAENPDSGKTKHLSWRRTVPITANFNSIGTVLQENTEVAPARLTPDRPQPEESRRRSLGRKLRRAVEAFGRPPDHNFWDSKGYDKPVSANEKRALRPLTRE